MKKNFLIIGLIMWPIISFAKTPNCANAFMNHAARWMQYDGGIVEMADLDPSKTTVTLLASEKKKNTNNMIKKKYVYTQIYRFVFYDDNGNSYQVITKGDTVEVNENDITEFCSAGLSDVYFVSKNNLSVDSK
ncbi:MULTISPECIES: hypothetical protein [unclassified Gilliamella]|uniref:hypothetical protein n=1 Tax=unclassified Gilliamella TaxID=2685620 RepID=UPI00080EDB7A|nr:hypothetical protein [Gilliamella apicola]OCG33132.1 hypothetical protein A9G32_12445 [Gilliamella apicola]OCG48907.1 hypothetical protein A9G26_09590 [Gilliamella apicola]OCG50477.1 hypothetical protein A9G27_01765 [Gilliamella apicola]